MAARMPRRLGPVLREGHFARCMQPGAQRVLCATTNEALECTACVNPDGSVAVVVLNRSDAALHFTLRVRVWRAAVQLPAHALASWTSRSSARHAAYRIACMMSSRSR